MKRISIIMGLLVIFTLAAMDAYAVGTPAGTSIANTATVNYTVGGSNYSVNSAPNTVRVSEILNLSLTWQDSPPGVTVSPGQSNRATTLRVTNTGNGSEIFTLSADSAVGGDTFDPTLVGIFFDTNGNGAYDAGTDIQYIPGTNDPNLAADAWVTVFVVNNIPAAVSDGNTGNTALTASTITGTGAPGTVLAGQGDGGTDAIIGTSTGTAVTTATYVVSSVTVSVAKSSQIIDQFGGTQPVPGATIRYTVTVTVTGTGTASNVVITDPVPANTSYTAGSLRLNTAVLSDALDGDAGDVGGTTAGTITVTLGNLTSSSPVQSIVFETIIN